LGGSSIWDANEAFYVETRARCFRAATTSARRSNYQPRLNKPVLSYWIVAGFYKVFDVSVGVQRLPIALGALTMIAAAAAPGVGGGQPGKPASGRRPAGGRAAAGHVRSPHLHRHLHLDLHELTLLFSRWRSVIRSAASFPAVDVRVRRPRRLDEGSGGGGAAGARVRHLPAGAPRAETHHRDDDSIGLVIVLAIVVPWYAALYQRYGWTYITSFIVGENIARYTEGLGVEQRRGLSFYLPVVFSDSFPWSLCLFGAAGLWLADWRALRKSGTASNDRGFRIRTLLLALDPGHRDLLHVFRCEGRTSTSFRSCPRSLRSRGSSSARRDAAVSSPCLERSARRQR